MKTAAAVLAVLVLAACTSSADRGPAASTPPTASLSTSTANAPSQPTPTSTAPTAPTAPTDWPTYHGDAARSGVSTTMPAAQGKPRAVASLTLDAAVYASPIVVGGTTIVATENDTVYAFDQANRQVWKTRLGDPSPAQERSCGNIDPLGITGTPVYDKASGLVFVAPEYGGPPRHELVALKLTDGSVQWRKSLDRPGVETKAMQERGALTIAGGRVWVPFGGLSGDCGGYKGRVIGMALDGSGTPLAYTVPTTREAGIWTPPGPSVDAAGHLFVSVGNGESGQGDPYDHSDSVLELDTNAKLVDSFSPTTWAPDNESDLDLGSQGPALVGKWVFIAGKSGTAYVLRHGHLGGIGGQVDVQDICRSFGGTAVLDNVVFVPCTDGVRAVGIASDGKMSVRWHAPESAAGSPVVGGGRVWVVDADGGVLHSLDPDTGRTLAQVSVGTTSRFATPALYGNRVLVGTMSGLAIVTTS
jgi:outer membrane protein assembly factor BamB